MSIRKRASGSHCAYSDDYFLLTTLVWHAGEGFTPHS